VQAFKDLWKYVKRYPQPYILGLVCLTSTASQRSQKRRENRSYELGIAFENTI
jgi:hypothetical protein